MRNYVSTEIGDCFTGEKARRVCEAAERMRAEYRECTAPVQRYLNTARDAVREADLLTRRVEHLREITMRVGSCLTGGSRSKGRVGGMESTMQKLLGAQEELQMGVEEMLRTVRGVQRAISAIPSQVMREVLLLRYTQNLSWEEISGQMCYSERGVMRVHREALLCLGAMARLGYLDEVLPRELRKELEA